MMIANIESVFNFQGNAFPLAHDDFIAAIPSSLGSRESLFNALAEKMRFPDYFGKNWDALEECLRDLWWIRSHRVVIVHADLPSLNQADQLTYLEILADCVKDWKPGEEHQLIVMFPPECLGAIRDLKKGAE